MLHCYKPAERDSYGFYYFVEFWLYHASNIATQCHEANTSLELSEAVLGGFRDSNAFRLWAATVSGKYICNQYVVPKPHPLHIAAAFGLQATAGMLVNGGTDVLATDDFGRIPVHYACRRATRGWSDC